MIDFVLSLIIGIDQSVLDFLYSLRSYPVTLFFIAVSEFGRDVIVLGIVVMAALWLLYKRWFADLFGLIVSVGGTAATILCLKYLVARARPDFWFQAYPEG